MIININMEKHRQLVFEVFDELYATSKAYAKLNAQFNEAERAVIVAEAIKMLHTGWWLRMTEFVDDAEVEKQLQDFAAKVKEGVQVKRKHMRECRFKCKCEHMVGR